MDVDGSELGSLAFRPRLVCMGIGFSFLLRFGIAGGRNGIGGGATWGGEETSTSSLYREVSTARSIELDSLLRFLFLFTRACRRKSFVKIVSFSFSFGIFIFGKFVSFRGI